MKYCVECSSEYQDDVRECADCGSQELVSEAEMHRRGLTVDGETDTRKFVLAGTAEDPLSAEQLGSALEAANIPVLLRARRSSSVDLITTAVAPWWEILVPEEAQTRASQILQEQREQIEASAEEAARAAEEEEAQTESGAKL